MPRRKPSFATERETPRPPTGGEVASTWPLRLSILATGVCALVVAFFIAVGVPWLLVRFVGNPLPSALPDLDLAVWSLRNGQISNRFWIGSLAIVVWAAWAQLTIALLIETAAVVSSVEAPSLPTFGLAGAVATQLVGAVVLLGVVASIVPTEVSALSRAPLSSNPPMPAPVIEPEVIERPTVDALTPLLRVDVERRTTLRSLASEHLGDVERWGEIRDHNIGSTMADGTVLQSGFTRISAGWTLEIPGVPEVIGTWKVREGDHFWAIAHETLEAAYGRTPSTEETTRYWQDIVELNEPQVRSGDPDLIHPGERFQITLPPLPADAVDGDAGIGTDGSALGELLPEAVFTPARGTHVGQRDMDVLGQAPENAPAEEVVPWGSDAAASGPNKLESVAPDAEPIVTGPMGSVPAPTTSERSTGADPLTASAAGPLAEQRGASESGPAAQPGGAATTRLVAGAVGLGFLAYGLARALRRRRELQWARRVEGHIPAPPSESAVLMMTDAEATSATRRAAALDQFLRSLFADLAPATATQISHIEISDAEIVLHTVGTIDALGPCRRNGTDSTWTISYSEAAAIGTPGAVASDAMPALVGLGVDPDTGGDVLLNLGHALGVELFGPGPARRAFMQTVATELATSPFADDLHVVCCGFGDELEDLRRVKCVDSVRAGIEEVRSDPFRSIDVTSAEDGSAVRTALLVADDVPSDELDELVQLTLSGAVVVAPGIESRWSVALSPGSVVVGPIDRTLRRQDLSVEQFAAVAELIATSALSEYVPPTPIAEQAKRAPLTVPDVTEDAADQGPTAVTADSEKVQASSDPPASVGVALDCDIEVRVLGRVEVVGAERDFESARALDVITYLAFHRDGADADQLRTWLWPVDEPPTDKAFANVLSRARKGLGVDDEGAPYLSRAGRDGVYRLSKAVATDFDRFMAHLEHAHTLDGNAALAQQVEALELLRGVPFTGGGATGFIWTDLGTRSHVDFTVDETAHACADAALALGDSATARWAAMKGLSVIPGCEQCYRRRLLAAAADRNRSELVAAMAELQRHLAADSGEPEAYDIVSPDLVDLYDELVEAMGRRAPTHELDLTEQSSTHR